jgi:hypothetical protein
MTHVNGQTIRVSPYSDQDFIPWDDFIVSAPMATFLHSRRFLAYHRDRFKDVSVILKDDSGNTVGLFPAAIDRSNAGCVVSHPGATFGGLIHVGSLKGEASLNALSAIRDFYAEQGFTTLRYKAVPYIYQCSPSGDDLYALFRLGAQRSRCDLSCTIDLANRAPISKRRKRSLARGQKRGVEVAEGAAFIDSLWQIVEENLDRKLSSKPVHSADEIRYLHRHFPENIRFVAGLLSGEVVAGVTLFSTTTVVRAQYIASNIAGNDACALDSVLEHCIEESKNRNMRYFDFGTSNTHEGCSLSTGIYKFKCEFGGGGVVHEFYDIELKLRGTDEC